MSLEGTVTAAHNCFQRMIPGMLTHPYWKTQASRFIAGTIESQKMEVTELVAEKHRMFAA